MSVITAEFLAEKALDLDDLAAETVGCKEFFDLVHAEEVPMVFVCRTHDVLRNFFHLKEISANRPAGDAAEFFYCCLKALD